MVFHEAGHAVIAELLEPGSTILMFASYGNGNDHAMTGTKHDSGLWDLRGWERKIMEALAGRAAAEIRLGVFDVGASGDMEEAVTLVDRLIKRCGLAGFDYLEPNTRIDSAELKARQETAAAVELARYDRLVREMLINNRDFLEAVAHALAIKGVLLAADIRSIREKHGITAAAV